MSKATAGIEFGTFETPEEVNPYIDVIPQMIEQGENASVTLTVPATEATRTRTQFSKAAHAHDKTARLRLTDDSDAVYETNENGRRKAVGGTVKLTFTLTERHKARRGAEAGK